MNEVHVNMDRLGSKKKKKGRREFGKGETGLRESEAAKDKMMTKDKINSQSLACSKSFGLSPYEMTYFPSRIPARSFDRNTSHLFKKSTIFVLARSWFETTLFQSKTESSYIPEKHI